MHTTLLVLNLLAAAPTLDERLKTLTPIGLSANGAPVDDRIAVMVVETLRVSFATDSRPQTALYEEEVTASPAPATVAQRLSAGGIPPRLKGAARGGTPRLNVVIDVRARSEIVLAALQMATDAGLTVQVVDVHARPWKRWFVMGLQDCHDGSVKDCIGEDSECKPNVCAQLTYAPLEKGVLVSGRRRLTDDTGACLEKQKDATPAAPTPWDGLWLKGSKDACPTLKEVTPDALKTFYALMTPHIPPCEAVTLQLGDEGMDRVGAMLNALSAAGAHVLTVEPWSSPSCDSAVALNALDARPAVVTVEAERVTGGLKQNAVMGVLRSQRAALTTCVSRARMSQAKVHGNFKASYRVTDAGSVALLKWETPPPDELKACFDGVIKGAAYDRAPRSSEVHIVVTAEK